ncbi:aspartic proteinase CDR1-like [Salvia divinorum]|uniref:Aspartic proteinase CDR1-like n=1 Tax=Salvia divinorum TaxID=28513 RepID=A0ABD1HZV7_SALDI
MAKTLKSNLFIPYITLVSIILCCCKCEPLANASSITGFTTDLLHRDSPHSPLYDPLLTNSQRLANARLRSQARSRRYAGILYGRKSAAEASLIDDNGVYLIQFFMGTPLKQAMALLDTGSHLIWTQCLPCKRCKRQQFPVFNPQSSSTYRLTRCGSIGCRAFGSNGFCDARREKCLFKTIYGDGSYSDGTVGSDTFTFHSGPRELQGFPKIVFGCGHDNYDKFEGRGSGIVGLGAGPGSLLSQLGYDKFSHCLVPTQGKFETSTMHFGSDAVVSGWGTVSMRLAEKDGYHYVTLDAISVGNKRFKYYSPLQGGNIVMDTGTVLTLLPVNLYDQLEVEIANSIPQRAVRDFEEWRLCYSEKFVMPKITVHFQGADVEWKHENAFVRVNQDYECLAIDHMDGLPIYGGVAQVNYLVGFDVSRNTVSFKPAECGR